MTFKTTVFTTLLNVKQFFVEEPNAWSECKCTEQQKKKCKTSI